MAPKKSRNHIEGPMSQEALWAEPEDPRSSGGERNSAPFAHRLLSTRGNWPRFVDCADEG